MSSSDCAPCGLQVRRALIAALERDNFFKLKIDAIKQNVKLAWSLPS
jgi:hypothetical protein